MLSKGVCLRLSVRPPVYKLHNDGNWETLRKHRAGLLAIAGLS